MFASYVPRNTFFTWHDPSYDVIGQMLGGQGLEISRGTYRRWGKAIEKWWHLTSKQEIYSRKTAGGGCIASTPVPARVKFVLTFPTLKTQKWLVCQTCIRCRHTLLHMPNTWRPSAAHSTPAASAWISGCWPMPPWAARWAPPRCWTAGQSRAPASNFPRYFPKDWGQDSSLATCPCPRTPERATGTSLACFLRCAVAPHLAWRSDATSRAPFSSPEQSPPWLNGWELGEATSWGFR